MSAVLYGNARAHGVMPARRGGSSLLVSTATCIAIALSLVSASSAAAYSGQHVAVVINDASADSVTVGEYYVRQRGVPADHVIRIRTAPDEVIDRVTYTRAIEEPIANALGRNRLHDKILYIVLTKGVPLRVNGPAGPAGTTASVDSELTVLYRRMVGEAILTRGPIDNPYYASGRSLEEMRSFSHREHDIFLVTRLDAFTAREAMALVDRCLAPVETGHVVLDKNGAVASRLGDEWLDAAARTLTAAGHGDRVLLASEPNLSSGKAVLGYYSWGSTDPSNRRRTLGFTFAPRALAATFVSTDARTFREPEAGWAPAESTAGAARFAGSAESLTADLIRQGAAGAAGHVAEPLLRSVVRPEILFPAYLAGFTLAEAFYLAMPHLSWQTVVVGDPLCRVGERPPLTAEELDPGIDPETEVPAWFAVRQKQRAARTVKGTSHQGVALLMRADNLIIQGKLVPARQALQLATETAPKMVEAHVRLAELDGRLGEIDASIEGYRRTLALAPDHLLAVNNLAYALAVHRHALAEALPLAQRAVQMAPSDGLVLDTLAWIEHLIGDHPAAVQRISMALRRNPDNPTVHLHAAFIYSAVDAQDLARTSLQQALQLAPELSEGEEVRQLRSRLLPPVLVTRGNGREDD